MTYDPRRRTLLHILGAITAISGIRGIGSAWSQVKRIRYGAHTTEGKEMLAIYANAVRIMKDVQKYPETDARSWLFQWYTHAVRRDRTKASEIQRVYKGSSADLAEAMWYSCEAHLDMDGSREDYFTPWHRIYVHCFEDIIREVSGRNDFTLPYWDYSNAQWRSLPEEFRKKGDPKWGPLFHEMRLDHANNGLPIDHPSGPSGQISLAAMSSTSYGDNGIDAGFCANLDGDLHGAVHVNVGNDLGMGDVPWAAADPIFWVHHCNIDRVWASWIRAGGTNPATSKFVGEAFTFADSAGKPVKVTVKEMLDRMEPTYDRYLDRPAGSPDFPAPSPMPVAQSLRFESGKSVKLKGKVVEAIRLRPPKQGPASGPLPVAGQQAIKQLPKEANLHLRLEEVTALGPAKGFFDVHVGSVVNAKMNRESPSYLGSLNFFSATSAHDVGGHSGLGKKLSFLVPPKARRLLEAQEPNLQVVFVPVGQVVGAQPVVGKVILVAR